MSGSALSSLDVVESFYGEELSRSLINSVSQTPLYQLDELCDQLYQFRHRYETAMRARFLSSYSVPGPLGVRLKDSFTLHENTYFSGFPSSTSYDMRTPLPFSPSQLETLKMLILYHEHILLHDGLTQWSWEKGLYIPEHRKVSEGDRTNLCHILRDMLKIAPLVRCGAVLLCDRVGFSMTPDIFDDLDFGIREPYSMVDFWRDEGFEVSLTDPGDMYCYSTDDRDHEIVRTDPYLAATAVYQCNLLPDWELRAREISTVTDLLDVARELAHLCEESPHRYSSNLLMDAARRAYGTTFRSLREVRESAGFSALFRTLGADPFATSTISTTNLLSGSQIVLDGPDRIRRMEVKTRMYEYRVPDLSLVSFDDVTKLRMNEDVYRDVRGALGELSAAVAQVSSNLTYTDFRDVVAEAAQDSVAPVYDNMRKHMDKQKLRGTIEGYAAKHLTKFAIGGIASLMAGPAARAVKGIGSAAGKAAKDAVSKSREKGIREREIATSILLSTLPEDHSPG